MENQNGTTQTASEQTPPPAAGADVAALQARLAELEKQSEGRLRDLQSERAKRQELEAKLTPPAPVSSTDKETDVAQDELGKVLTPYIAPVMARVKQAEAFVANTYRDKALEHLAAKTGKSKEAVLSDKELDDKLSSIVKRYGFTGNVYDVTVRAVQIMELENLQAQEAERKRTANANVNSSLPTGTNNAPVSMGSKEYSEEDWAAMPLHEYEKLASAGDFTPGKDGKIVFTPRPK